MRSAALIVALLVLAGSLAGPAAAVVADDPTRPQVDQQAETFEYLSTDVVVSLQANGSARWTVTVTYALDTDTQRAAFDAYRTEFEGGNATGLDPALFESLAAEGSESTDRRMRIRDVEYRSSATEDRGSLTLAFTWSNFLERPDRETLRFHDALLVSGPNPEGRLWLATLEPNQTMTIQTPPGYSVNSTQAPSFEFENNAVVIEGPQEFDGDLTITYERTEPTDRTGAIPWALLAGAFALAVAIVVAAYLLRRRDDESPSPVSSANGSGPGDVPPDAADDEGDAAENEDSEADDVDLSLLSDEERVERLIERNGGRMKQATIVRETGWSDAKVSQLLSSMADEGRVEKLRLGRENLISLPGDDSE